MSNLTFVKEKETQDCADQDHHVFFEYFVILEIEEVMVDEPYNPDYSSKPSGAQKPVSPWKLPEPQLGPGVLPQIPVLYLTAIGHPEQVELSIQLALLPLSLLAVGDTGHCLKD